MLVIEYVKIIHWNFLKILFISRPEVQMHLIYLMRVKYPGCLIIHVLNTPGYGITLG